MEVFRVLPQLYIDKDILQILFQKLLEMLYRSPRVIDSIYTADFKFS